MIEAFVFDPRTISEDALLERGGDWLDPTERARYQRFSHALSAHVYLATRVVVRTVLARALGVAPPALAFDRDVLGRPTLHDHPLCFSLANGPTFVLCTLGPKPHGVDAEPLDRAEALLGMASTVYSDDERAHLTRCSAPHADAVLLWTLKEAYLKARGIGLRVDPRLVSFTLGGGGVTLALAPPLVEDGGIDRFQPLAFEGHLGAVAGPTGEVLATPRWIEL